jgi:hypothetical protein
MVAVSIGCDALSPPISHAIETLDVWRSRAPISTALRSRWADQQALVWHARKLGSAVPAGWRTDWHRKKAAVSTNRRPIRESQ